MNESEFEDVKIYTLTLSKKLKNRLHKHLEMLKILNRPQSKRNFWLMEALQEKLDQQENSTDPPSKKYLTLSLNQEIIDQINACLNTSRKASSKKKWILEAIEEKLEIEIDSF